LREAYSEESEESEESESLFIGFFTAGAFFDGTAGAFTLGT